MLSTIRPPARGPIASASAETPAQIPIAWPRSFGGNVAVMIDSVAGFMSAAPIPCTARAPMRKPALGASPQASDESVKTTMPTMKIRRRPYRSASLPPVIISAANVSAYAVTIHSSEAIETWRSRSIDGSATFTTVLSSMIMKRPNDTAASVHHFLLSSAKIRAFILSPGRSWLVLTKLASTSRSAPE